MSSDNTPWYLCTTCILIYDTLHDPVAQRLLEEASYPTCTFSFATFSTNFLQHKKVGIIQFFIASSHIPFDYSDIMDLLYNLNTKLVTETVVQDLLKTISENDRGSQE